MIRTVRLYHTVYYPTVKHARRRLSRAAGLLDLVVLPLWVISSVLGWVVVLRRSNGVVASDWMTPSAYRLHRGIIALSTLMM